jgi:hypothetical protein
VRGDPDQKAPRRERAVSNYPKPSAKSKSRLKLVKPAKPEGLRAWGLKPPNNMPAGHYRVVCESAAKGQKWGKPIGEFEFRVVDQEFMGVSLPAWIPIDLHAGKVKPNSRYYRYCTMALGEEPSCDEELDPRVFVGKVFLVDARYARTDGKRKAVLDDTKWKGSWDYIRVGLILDLAEL